MKIHLGRAAAAALVVLCACGGSQSKTVEAPSGDIIRISPLPPPVSFSTPNAANSSFAVSAAAVADGSSPVIISMTVRDALGNGVSQIGVTFAASDPAAAISAVHGVTDIYGVFTAQATSLNLGPCSFSATAAGFSLSGQTTFTAGPPAAAQSTLTLDRSSILADEEDAAVATVLVKDAQGNPLPGVQVLLQPAAGMNVSPAGGTTDLQGRMLSLIDTSTIGVQTLSASFNGSILSSQLIGTQPPPVPGNTSFSAIPATGVRNFDLATPVSITARDRLGRPVPGAQVQVSLDGVPCIANPPSGLTGANGVFTTGLVAGQDGMVLVVMQVGTALLTGNIVFTHDVGTALLFTSFPRPTIAGTPGLVQVEVIDAAQNLVDDSASTVTISARDPAGHDVPLTGASAVAVHGVATFDQLTATSTAIVSLVAHAAGMNDTTLGFTVTAGNVASLSFLVQPGNISATASAGPFGAPFSVQVVDAFGNPTGGGSSVSLSPSIAGPIAFNTTATVASNGVATFSRFAMETAGTFQLVAHLGSLVSAPSAPFSVSGGNAIGIGFFDPIANVEAGQVLTPAPKVIALDQFLNVTTKVSGNVTVSASAGTLNGTLTQPFVNGAATFPGLSIATTTTRTGVTLRPLSGSLQVAVSPAFSVLSLPSTTLSTVAVTGSSTQPANGVTPAQIRVTLRDAGNQALTNRSVVITSTPPGLAGQGTTAAGGVVTIPITSTVAGAFQLNVATTTIVTATNLPAPSVTFVPDPATTTLSFAVLPSATAAPTGLGFPVTITATVADANGNPWVNDQVFFSSTLGSVFPNGSSTSGSAVATTGADGKASVQFESTQEGVATVTVADSLAGLRETLPITFAGGPVSAMSFVTPQQMQPNQPFTVTLHMIDNANRPVSAVGTVTLSLAQNPAGDTLAGTTTATLSAGAATFSVQLAKPARGVQLRAACSGGCPSAGNSDAFTVQVPRFAAPLAFNPSQRSVAEGVAVNLDWLLDGTPSGLALLGPSTYGAPLASAVPLALAGPISTIPFPAATAPGTSATYHLRTSSDSFGGWLPDPPVPPTRLPANLTPAGLATLPDGTLALIAQAAGDFVFKGMTSTALSSGADCVVLRFLDSNFVLSSIHRFGAPGATCQPLAVAAAKGGAGDLYVSGNYSGSIPFGAQTISSECGANCQQGFVLKLTVAGSVPWVSHFGPASSTNWAGANLNTLEALMQSGNDSGVAVYGSAGFAHVNTLPAAGGTINFVSGSTQTRQMAMPQAVFATLGILDASGSWSFTGYGATQTARTFSSESPKGINSSSAADIAESSDGSLFVAFKSGIDVLGNAPPPGDNTAMTLTRGFATGYDGARNLTFQGATITSEGTDQVAPFSEDSILGQFASNSPPALTLAFCGDRNVACNKLAALPGGGVLVQGSSLLTTVAFPPISISTSPAVLDDGSVAVSDRQFVVQLDSALRGISGSFISTFDIHDSFDETTPVPSKLFAGPDGGFALLGSSNGMVTFGLLDEQRQSVGGSPRPGQQWPFMAWFGPDARLRWVDSMPGGSFAGMLLLPDQTMLVLGQSSSPAMFGGADWDPASLPAGPFLGPLGGANYKSLVITQSP